MWLQEMNISDPRFAHDSFCSMETFFFFALPSLKPNSIVNTTASKTGVRTSIRD
jgi:hypothetical protein